MSLVASPETWPLVGRAGELSMLKSLRDEGRPGAVLSGAAGVGKSRLAREALAAAAERGALTEWVQATRSAAAVPMGALAGLLAGGSRSDDPLERMRTAAETLRERAGRREVVIGVDDAQLLDPASAALVLHLVTSGTAFVVATVRTGERPPDAVVSLWKDTGAQRLELGELGERETRELVESALGGPVEHRTLQWLYGSSRGNVLYVRELLLGALRVGALADHDGLWTASELPPISRSLAELVEGRMQDLAAEERRAIELIALGEPLRLDEAEELAGLGALAGAEARGMIAIDSPADGGTVRLSHPMYGEAVRASMPAMRGRELRIRLAARVQERDSVRPQEALRIARWLLDAGETVPPQLLLDAAGAANAAGDADLGARLAEQAVADGAGARGALLLARAHGLARRFEAAEAVLASLEGRIEDEELAIDYLEARVYLLVWHLNRQAELPALLERAERWWPGPEWQRRLDLLRVHVTVLAGDAAEMAAASGRTLADPDLDPVLRHQMEPVHASNLYASGRAREGWELACAIRPPVPLRRQSDEVAFAVWHRIATESGIGWDVLLRELPEMFAQAIATADDAAAGHAAFALGNLTLRQGRFRDAIRWLTEAELHLAVADVLDVRPIALATRARAVAETGDVEGTRAALEALEEALGGRHLLPARRAHVVQAYAWSAYLDGDHARAQEAYQFAAAETTAQPPVAAMLLFDSLRVGGSSKRLAGPLRALSDRCDAPLVHVYAEHAAAYGAGDGGALLKVSDAYERIGPLLYAMVSARHAAGCFLREGREDSARRAAARAHALYQPDQGGQPPSVPGLDGGEVELTRREAQLAALAAGGLTNAEIADRLVLSVRTVESHVYRAMHKLGVNDRRQLPTTQ